MDKALQSMIDNMPEKTGKSLEEWFEVLSNFSFEKHSQAVNFLKKDYGVSHGFANTIVVLFKRKDTDEVDFIKQQYTGKENLQPIYQELHDYIVSLGTDVQVSPKKTSVSYIRKRQFALIKPATKKRVDLGLKLKDIEPQGVLGDSGPFGTMCTHRITLESKDQITQEVKDWIAEAYQRSE